MVVALVAGACVVTSCVTLPVNACGNVMAFSKSELVRAITRATAELDDGLYAEAIATLRTVERRHTGSAAKGDAKAELDATIVRAELVWMKALVRGHLAVAPGLSLPGDSIDFEVEDHAFRGPKDVTRALARLDALARQKRYAADVRELRAEASVRLPERRVDSLAVLAKLAREDLLTAPESWSTYADALAAADPVAASAARSRCRTMAKAAALQCAPRPLSAETASASPGLANAQPATNPKSP